MAEKDPKLNEIEKQLKPFFKKRNLKFNTKRGYCTTLKAYTEFLGYSINEMITEAEQEQISYINDKNQIIHPDVEKSNLKYYLDSFQEQELKRISPTTVDKSISSIRAVYKTLGNNLKLPSQEIILPKKDNKNDNLTKEEIARALDHSNSKYKSLITFLGSTGVRVSDTMKLTYGQWIKAVDKKTIRDAVDASENLIGFYNFKPTKTKRLNILCQTFNSPESNKLIQIYSKERESKGEILKEETLIFPHGSKNYSHVAVAEYFRKINKKLMDEQVKELENLLLEEKINQNEFNEKVEKITYFHPHALRSYFITMVGSYCNNLKIGSRLAGHTMPEKTDDNYIKFSKDELLPHYKKLIPYLTFKEKAKVRLITDEKVEKLDRLEEENRSMSRRLNFLEKKFSDEELDVLTDEFIK